MQAATTTFGSATMPLVFVRAMQAVKSIGRVGLGRSLLAQARAPAAIARARHWSPRCAKAAATCATPIIIRPRS